MNFIKVSLAVVSFLLSFLSWPVYSQELWKIYHVGKNEQVYFILQTRQVLDSKNFDEYNSELVGRLTLRYPHTIEPLFISAPSIKERLERHRFEPRYDLQKFYLLGISSKEEELRKSTSPFEFARNLRTNSANWIRGEMALESVEPDLPISAYPTGKALSSNNCPSKKDSPKDRAWPLRTMKVIEAWKQHEKAKGPNIKIGHPDTGYSDHVDLDNEALIISEKNNFIEKDTEPRDPLNSGNGLKQPGHGTSTGSVIISRGGVTDPPPEDVEGGTVEPGKVTGVAIEAELIPYRSIKSVARFTYGNVIKAIYEAVKDECAVISLSLGGLGSRALKAALEYAIEDNVIIVAAAGNFNWAPVVYPARYPCCIAVAATCSDDRPWESSAHGKSVTISAPGESVWRAYRSAPNESNEKVAPSCGTSYSTANVAGVAALFLKGMAIEMLEPCAMKVACTVLRGLGAGNGPRLPDSSIMSDLTQPQDVEFL